MKTWLKWMLIITQVGGGFAGITLTLEYILRSVNMPSIFIFISIGIILCYAFVVVAGVLFALDERRTFPLRIALWMQVPYISSPVVGWLFSAGFFFIPSFIGGKLGIEFWLGSKWWVNLFQQQPWGIGINLFAVLMLVLLMRKGSTPVEASTSIASQVDTILQYRLLNTNLADRGIHLCSKPDGGVTIVIDSKEYASVEGVPEENIRLLIQSAIEEWKAKTATNEVVAGN